MSGGGIPPEPSTVAEDLQAAYRCLRLAAAKLHQQQTPPGRMQGDVGLVDFLASHTWSPAIQACMCGEAVVWGDHPKHLAHMLRVGEWEDHLDELEKKYPITATDARLKAHPSRDGRGAHGGA